MTKARLIQTMRDYYDVSVLIFWNEAQLSQAKFRTRQK
jgi:hypothetical protein